jgi:hypothetical protein
MILGVAVIRWRFRAREKPEALAPPKSTPSPDYVALAVETLRRRGTQRSMGLADEIERGQQGREGEE